VVAGSGGALGASAHVNNGSARPSRVAPSRFVQLCARAKWRTASRNARATCSSTAPRPRLCAPISAAVVCLDGWRLPVQLVSRRLTPYIRPTMERVGRVQVLPRQLDAAVAEAASMGAALAGSEPKAHAKHPCRCAGGARGSSAGRSPSSRPWSLAERSGHPRLLHAPDPLDQPSRHLRNPHRRETRRGQTGVLRRP
jgi:hypothetical protein